jgi:uncharacterized delta-60 repeat protein
MMTRSRAICRFLPFLWLTSLGATEVTLDAGFGVSGLARPEFPGQPSLDAAGDGRCVAVQEDGKIVIAGQSLAGGLRSIVLLRFLADGQPDTNFDSGGVALLVSPHGDDQAAALLLQEGGDILVAGRTFSNGSSDMLLLRLNADGTPDTGFGTGGRLEVDFEGSDDSAQALTLDTQGRLLAAGAATQNGKRSTAVLRCLPDGTPDASFGDAGRAVFNLLSASSSEARGLVVQASGRIVAGGQARVSTTDRLALFAFTPAGAHDTSFGTDGSTLTVAGSGSSIQSQGHSLIALTGGQLLLAGTGSVNGVPHAALARYTADGALDTGFGSGGTVITSAGTGETTGRCVIQQADGSLLMAASLAGASIRFAALRYSSGGSLDTGFGSGGVALVAFAGFDADCFAVAPSTAGFVLAGTLAGGSASSFGVARCTTTGSLDTTLSGDGRLEKNLLRIQPFAQARAVRQQPDGKIVLAGSVGTASGMDFVVCRFLANGSADPDFGTQGSSVIAPGLEDDFAYRMLLQPDGKILVAGTSLQDGLEKACIIRLLSDGNLDPDFGSGGVFFDQTGGADCGIYALALQADGKIVAAGYAYNGAATRLQCALWRLTAAGTLDTTFNTTGRLLSHVTASTRDAYATAVAIQANSRIVTAGPAYTDSGQTQASFGLLRCLSTGVLDTSFDGDGRIAVALGGHAAQAQALAVQSDGALVVAGFAEAGAVGGSSGFAAVRLLASGAVDSSFGTSGWTRADFPGFGDRSYDLALDNENRALLIGTTYITSARIALLRLTPTGAADSDFGSAGQAVLDSGMGDHLAFGGAYDASGRLLIAGSADGLMAGRALLPATANTAPVATDDTGFVLPAMTVLLDVLANDTDADNDVLTLASWTQPVPGGSVTRSGSRLQFTAATGFTGASFTYTISDGNGGEDTATVTLTPVATYAAWRVACFGEQADDPAVAAPEADADHDGMDNLTEYALGSDPLQAIAANGTPGRDGSGRLTLTYQTWVAAEDITVTPVFSSDLVSWTHVGVFTETLADDGIRRTLRATAPASLPTQPQFGRLQIAQP